jgi:hypothetical protein
LKPGWAAGVYRKGRVKTETESNKL